ncbi:MAG: YraN family protein [Bacteroidota bacterium]
MTESAEFGRRAEQLAANYLIAKGYRILHTNWRFYKKEIDIVCTNGNELIIAEVKARNCSVFPYPGEVVPPSKQRHLVDAAEAYIFRYNIDLQTRFDLIAIIYNQGGFEIEHIEAAWYPSVN